MFLSSMRFGLTLLLAFFLEAATANQFDNEPVPERWREEIFFDQYLNIFDRRDQSLGIDHTFTQDFYEFLVPKGKVRLIYGSRESIPESFAPEVPKDGQEFVRFFVPNISYVNVLDKMRRDFGDPVKTWPGVKIQSKATFHLWNPQAPNDEPIRIKIERDWDFKNGKGRINTFYFGKNSVLLSTIIQSLETQNPFALGSFYQEPFTAAVQGRDYTYSYVFRTVPREALNRGNRLAFVPLHGFINSPMIAEMAARRGLSVQFWLRNEYLPKLAKLAAYYNFSLGVWFEGHSQNISLLIDRNTGEIIKFFLKDAADIMMNPFQQSVRGILPNYSFLPPSRSNEVWIDENSEPAGKRPGYYSHDYLFQSVTGMTDNLRLKRKHVAIFLENYLQAAGLLLAQLPLRSRVAIQNLAESEEPNGFTYTLHSSFGIQTRWLVDYAAVAAKVMQEIADLRATIDFQSLVSTELNSINETEHSELKRIVNKQITENKFNWATSESQKIYESWSFRKHYSLLPIQNGIILYESNQNYPIGVAYHLSDSDVRYVNSVVARKGGQSQCSVFKH